MRKVNDFWPIKDIIYQRAPVFLLSGRYGDNSVSEFFINRGQIVFDTALLIEVFCPFKGFPPAN